MNTTAFPTFSVRIFSPWRDGQETFQESDIPARSRLYPLDPQAMGNLWQESFTSYLNRLGWTHHVSPRAMVMQEVIPRLENAQNASRQWIGARQRPGPRRHRFDSRDCFNGNLPPAHPARALVDFQ